MSDWLTIRTPTGTHHWPLDPRADVADQVMRARVLTGFPAGDGWVTDGTSPWSVTIAPGVPYDVERGRVAARDAAELAAVTAEPLTAYVTEVESLRQADRQAQARARWDELSAAQQDAVLAERSTTTSTTTTTQPAQTRGAR